MKPVAVSQQPQSISSGAVLVTSEELAAYNQAAKRCQQSLLLLPFGGPGPLSDRSPIRTYQGGVISTLPMSLPAVHKRDRSQVPPHASTQVYGKLHTAHATLPAYHNADHSLVDHVHDHNSGKMCYVCHQRSLCAPNAAIQESRQLEDLLGKSILIAY